MGKSMEEKVWLGRNGQWNISYAKAEEYIPDYQRLASALTRISQRCLRTVRIYEAGVFLGL